MSSSMAFENLPSGALKVFVFLQVLREGVVGYGELQVPGMSGHGGVADETLQDHAVESGGAGFLGRNPLAGVARDHRDLALQRFLELGDGNIRVADLGQRATAEAAEHIIDVPEHAEADDQNAEQDLGQPALGAAAEGVEHRCLVQLLARINVPRPGGRQEGRLG